METATTDFPIYMMGIEQYLDFRLKLGYDEDFESREEFEDFTYSGWEKNLVNWYSSSPFADAGVLLDIAEDDEHLNEELRWHEAVVRVRDDIAFLEVYRQENITAKDTNSEAFKAEVSKIMDWLSWMASRYELKLADTSCGFMNLKSI